MSAGRRMETRWRYLDFVEYASKSASGEGHLANASDNGVFVRTDRSPKPGEPVQMVFRGVAPTLTLKAHVRWVGRRHDGAEGFGAKLVDPPQAYLDLMRSLAENGAPDERGPRRVASRMVLSIPVAVEFGALCDEGTLTDISLSGARLERVGIRPPEGSQVTITFALDGYEHAFEVVARVVRSTDSGGYAVQFEAIDPKLKLALEHAASILLKLPDSYGG